MKTKLSQLLVFFSVFGLSVASAQIYLIDQKNESLTYIYYSIPLLGPMGQEFQPTFSSLDFVDLSIEPFGVYTVPGELAVSIHSGTIDGTTLGTSSSLLFTQNSATVGRFLFPAPVSLTPGNTYVLSVQSLAGGGWFVGGGDGTYSPGRIILQGEPNTGVDLFFREGIRVPEPEPGALMGGGIAAFFVLRRKAAQWTRN